MSRDLIKPLLANNKVYGINFKDSKINIFKNTSFAVNFDGPQQYGRGFTDSDLWINNTKFGFGFEQLFNPNTQFTAIYKYKVISWSDYFIPNRSIAGIQPNLCASGGEFGVWNKNGRWFRDGGAFGYNKGATYELAFECTTNRLKIWLNGVLKRTYNMSWSLDEWFSFGDPSHNLKMYINDILVTNALFLPNNYTVDWDNNWFDKFNWYLYEHDKEALAMPKKDE